MKKSAFFAVLYCSLFYFTMVPSVIGAQTQSVSTEPKLVSPGEVISKQEITIGPPNIRNMWSFKIEYLAPENAQVKKGDVLVKFDGESQRRALVDRQSKLDAAIKQKEQEILRDIATEQELILAVAEAQKNQDIARQKAEITDVSRSQIERKKYQAELNIATTLLEHAKQKLAQHAKIAKINEEVRKARVDKRRARLEQTKEALAKLNLYAPADGMVTYIADWEDNKPAVGENVYMGRSLMQLPSLEQLAVKVQIDEADVAQISAGQKVRVVLDDHPERAFSGVVSHTGRTFRTRSKYDLKVVIDAWIELDDPDKDMMRPGMKANVEFI